jgi:uncharacterized paraquat-inducible protein A
MPDIVCPECGQVAQLVAIRHAADEFCTKCDYPLFWAPSAVPTSSPGSSNMATMRRLPGAGGRQRVGSKVCPECGELNPLAESYCIRCTADLDPKPPPPPEPEPEPIVFVPPPPEPEPAPEPPWWPWPAIGLVWAVTLIWLIVAIW